MKKINSDILIVGGGLTGLMTAYAFSDLNIEIVVVDKSDLGLNKNNNDLRTTAISEGSKQFFEKINIWKKIKKFAEPIKYIKVIDRKPKRKIDFYNSITNNNLGYIVRNSLLKNLILKSLKKKQNVKLIGKSCLNSYSNNNQRQVWNFDKIQVEPKLLIAADGKKSKVRDLLQTHIYKKEYDQKALIVNFHHSNNHHSTAYELFYKSGPLALLPMKKIKINKYSSSLIWSHNPDFINNLFKIDKKLLSLILEEKIQNYVGEINEIIDVQIFSLSAHINSKFFEEKVLYLGDSAHSIHPIAGQGWNLGIRDIEKCLEVIKENLNLGLELGSKNICKQYQNKTYHNAYILFQVTDKLNKIFLKNNFIFNNFRARGFSLINKNKIIKKEITNFAMGFN